MTARQKISAVIEALSGAQGFDYEEREHSITVKGGNKYIFTTDGELKSVIRGGNSYGPEGKR